MHPERGYVVGERLLHPAFLGSVAVLALNDHVLKRVWPGLVTGKLSDLAGLCFFPILLVSFLEIAAGRGPLGRRWLISSAAATALAFTLAKTSGWGAEAYRQGLGALQWGCLKLLRGFAASPRGPVAVSLVRDATDLVALPMVAVGPWLERRRVSGGPS